MKQLHVGVLFGGSSTEHEVSRKSATTILRSIPKTYKKTAIGITKAGKWYAYFGDESLIAGGEWENEPETYEIFFSSDAILYQKDGTLLPLEIDVIFPVLHGRFGEDGTVQGLFEMLGIPYVGCGVCASAAAMDKSMTKLLVSTAGIRQADFVLVTRYNKNRLDDLIEQSEQKLGYPVFVKPCRSGSSVGVTKATDRSSLREGLENALRYDDRILIEEGIDARELECAVLEAGGETVAEVGEVISALDYYDYDSKYNNPSSRTETSPDLPGATLCEIREKAIRIFRLLDCRGLSRVDFFVDKKSGEVIFNEINTLPGFTSISMYPMLIEKHGICRENLVDRLIREALSK